jgi:MiaB-like tRNA modifying enzyme
MSNIYIETYGCSNSQTESEIMAGLLEQAGFRIINNEKYSDLIIVVTCYVKSATEQKIIFRLKELQEKYPKKKLIIAGCMPEGIYRRLVDTAPNANLVSTHHITKIVQAVQKTLEGKRVEFLGESKEVKLCLPKIRKNPVIAIVPISSGCNSYCSYCCVRLAKGKLFSYPKEKIIEEVKNSVNQGCKEIWLTAQDTASYGLDEGKAKLPELMNEIAEIPGSFLVRIGMMNPKNVLPILSDLIKSYKNQKVLKFLHLPVQSGDDVILEKMNRGYKSEDFEKIVKEFGNTFKFQLWTDIIVGFPRETEKQFKNTLDLIKRIKPDWVNISKYGKRPNTLAAKLESLSPKIINERSMVISKLVREISLEKDNGWIDWAGTILISERGKKPRQWIGRNLAYKPVLVESKENLLGKFVDIKVIDRTSSHLVGLLS